MPAENNAVAKLMSEADKKASEMYVNEVAALIDRFKRIHSDTKARHQRVVDRLKEFEKQMSEAPDIYQAVTIVRDWQEKKI
jgi:hypothetical protein